jgi:transposase InsO family protein
MSPVPDLHPLRQRADLTANALHDWCQRRRSGTSHIEPGSPLANPWVESYGSRMRDTLLEAQARVADWRIEYNKHRPHSVLGMLIPSEHADQWEQTNQPQLSDTRTNQRARSQQDDETDVEPATPDGRIQWPR